MTNQAPLAYFAYGSNLSLRQMRDRCPTAVAMSPAILEHHRLVFPRHSESWNGGVAGIEPEQGGSVHGAIYKLQQSDLDALDDYEGIADGQYTRNVVQVISPDGSAIKVITYFACRENKTEVAPSRKYLETILEGARDHQLPTEWIDWLGERLEMIDSQPDQS
jgi:gamma-glutamylcyclotransferase